jgi:choline dehydrogenase-like flavoprotein
MQDNAEPETPRNEGNLRGGSGLTTETADFLERVRVNQQKLTAQLKPHYDFIVCGTGSSGSVVARRLAENADVSVLLLEAGEDDDIPEVMEANQWPKNIGSERDWRFQAQANPHLNGRSIPLSMGKVLGGGSSINVMGWARGHQPSSIGSAQHCLGRDPARWRSPALPGRITCW